MYTKADLKKVMKDIKDAVKEHKLLHKSIFGEKTIKRGQGKEMLNSSRRKIQILLAREEEVVRVLLEKKKSAKGEK